MAKKSRKNYNNDQQLSLFDQVANIEVSQVIPENITEENQPEFEELEDYDDEDFGLDGSWESSNYTIEAPERELITLQLLKEAIIKQNPDDQIMADFAEYVLPNLLKVAVGVTAKGGKWIEAKEQEMLAEGKTLDRRNAGDQSLNTHLLNGLFPANIIEQVLEKLDTTVRRVIKEKERRLLIAGFILHDFEKFDYSRFPEMPEKYLNVTDIRKLSIAEHKEILQVIITYLQLDKFINPDQPESYQEYLDDLLATAYNAQIRYDTNWNFSVHSDLQPKLNSDKLECLATLACLADRLASIIKHPQDAQSYSLKAILHKLSNEQLKLTYHSIAENRGVLTNVVNNALIDAHLSLNTDECEYYKPLLYLPTGVIYLTLRNAPSVNIDHIPNLVINKIKSLCAGELRKRQTGFSRDGKGMKYAEYYELFFDDIDLMKVTLDATLNILNDNKTPVSTSRSENLISFQQKEVLPANNDFSFKDDLRIDRIAEFGDAITRKIWGTKVEKIEELIKKNKTNRNKNKELPELPSLKLTSEILLTKIAKYWDLAEYLPVINSIQTINKKLKDKKLKGNTGGVPYEWYYLAAKYIEKNPGIEDVNDVCLDLINYLDTLIKPVVAQYQITDGWDDLRTWLEQVVMLPEIEIKNSAPNKFLEELNNYQLAKKSGRGRQQICSVSHSAYTVTQQKESAVLFMPQVYTNKQMLGGSNATRNISSIAGLEMMLRQILMSQTKAIGASFEEAKYRYLYFYPTYYCTPETNSFLHKAYDNVRQTRFDTGVRNHFISKDFQANFELNNYQTVDIFHLDEQHSDKTFKLSYPETQPLTFYFMALPPEKRGKDKKPTDTESWIMPAWLGLAFPMILDVKIAVSESPIPPFIDGAEFEETVVLDSAPIAIQSLIKRDRFRLDYILEGWQETNGKSYPAPLNTLTAAYAINIDVNAKQTKKGYEPNWGKLTELAKDFETTPLSVFTYLNKWVRNQKVDTARIDKIKLYAYYFYPCFDPYVTYNFNEEKFTMTTESPLNHPLNLTRLYRKFYRAKSSKGKPIKANAILKPIDEAADVILKAEKEIFQGEILVDAVAARIFKLMDRVHSSTAEGRWIIAHRDEEREAILEFANYFVNEVFEGAFAGDRARLAGRQLNIIRDTCEFLYRLENDKEYREKKAQGLIKDDSNSEEE